MDGSEVALTFSQADNLIDRLTQWASNVSRLVLGIPMRLLTTLSLSGERQEHLGSLITEAQRLIKIATNEGIDRDLFRILDSLAANRQRIEQALVVWIDLIEVLVQLEETRHGSTPGMGGVKTAELKEAVRYLLRNQRLNLPGIPKPFEPIVIDYAVGVLVDAVVLACNRYGLWVNTEPQPGGWTSVLFGRLKRWLEVVLTPVYQFLAAA